MGYGDQNLKLNISDLSLGVVSNKETILLAVIDPMNWNDVGYTADAFQKQRLIACQQSVSRQKYSSPSRIKRFVFDALLVRGGRVAVGVQLFNAGGLRGLKSGILQSAFVIKDAPIVHRGRIDFAHAHIGFSDEIAHATVNKRNIQAAAILNLRSFLQGSGSIVDCRLAFPMWPFVYMRLSEIRLLVHRFRLWSTGKGKRFIQQEADPS